MTTLARGQVELPVAVERGSPVSLAAQITAELRAAVADGRLAAGERLASSRALASSLGVSRTVVTSAYAQLYAEGWLDGRHGSGTYVAAGAPGGMAPAAPAASSQRAAPGQRAGPGTPLIEMRPGIPWASGIDRAAWRRAWRRAGAVPPSASLDPMGLKALRVALAGHLRLSRAVRCA